MLNEDDNENGFKTNRSNQQKNKLHVQHTFSSNQQKTNLHVQNAFLSLPCRCFARLQRCFVRPLRICSHVPIKGRGGWYIPNRGAPWPSCFPLFLPNLGAPLPVIFLTSSTANEIPIDAKTVPMTLPSCVLVGFI